VDVRYVSADGVADHPAEDFLGLLARDDGFVWVDVPELDDQAERALATTFGFHGLTLQACRERNHVPQLLFVLAVMVAMSATLLRWTKRQGWW
jgi:magnesium transporter